MGEIRQWSSDANVGYQAATPAPDGAPEGMPASQVNDTERETMAAVRRRLEEHSWFDYGDAPTFISASSFSVADTYASAYEVGRRIRAIQGVDPDAFGTIATASSGGGTTTVTLTMDSGDSLTSNIAQVEVGTSTKALPPEAPIANNARIVSDQYTGDGTATQAITGLGFQPVYVKVVRRETADGTTVNVFESWTNVIDDDASGMSILHDNNGVDHSVQTGAIKSLDADGFSVGGVGDPNQSGQTYNFIAIG